MEQHSKFLKSNKKQIDKKMEKWLNKYINENENIHVLTIDNEQKLLFLLCMECTMYLNNTNINDLNDDSAQIYVIKCGNESLDDERLKLFIENYPDYRDYSDFIDNVKLHTKI